MTSDDSLNGRPARSTQYRSLKVSAPVLKDTVATPPAALVFWSSPVLLAEVRRLASAQRGEA